MSKGNTHPSIGRDIQLYFDLLKIYLIQVGEIDEEQLHEKLSGIQHSLKDYVYKLSNEEVRAIESIAKYEMVGYQNLSNGKIQYPPDYIKTISKYYEKFTALLSKYGFAETIERRNEEVMSDELDIVSKLYTDITNTKLKVAILHELGIYDSICSKLINPEILADQIPPETVTEVYYSLGLLNRQRDNKDTVIRYIKSFRSPNEGIPDSIKKNVSDHIKHLRFILN